MDGVSWSLTDLERLRSTFPAPRSNRNWMELIFDFVVLLSLIWSSLSVSGKSRLELLVDRSESPSTTPSFESRMKLSKLEEKYCTLETKDSPLDLNVSLVIHSFSFSSLAFSSRVVARTKNLTEFLCSAAPLSRKA